MAGVHGTPADRWGVAAAMTSARADELPPDLMRARTNPPSPGPQRPGVMTTEFWLAVGVTLLINAGAIWSGNDLAQLGATLGSALLAAGYGLARTRAKTGGYAGVPASSSSRRRS